MALRVPQRGQRRALLDIAHRNAREEVERVTDAVQRINGTLRLLQETAQLPVLPRRMESYDISHTGGADQVGGMVVFQDGKPLKSAYRRFRIESCTGADDYGAMREVLTRRFRRYLDGDEKFAPLPDLLLIDGGQEHARVAEQVLAGCGLDVPVLGMVKDDRHRTRALITARGHELGIQQTPALFALIGTVQEEVHRFAIAYHHQKHTRSAKRSQLDGIPGVGEARKKRLLQHFGTVTAVKNAALEQLSAVVPEAAAGRYMRSSTDKKVPPAEPGGRRTQKKRETAKPSLFHCVYSSRFSISSASASTASFSSLPSAISVTVVSFIMPRLSTPSRLFALTRRSSFSTQMPLLNSLAF